MTQIIKHLQAHRSYRDFDESYEIPEADLKAILDATRQASSWMNGQFYSLIVIRDKSKRQQLVEWNPGNPHMLKSSVFILFVADFNRSNAISDYYQTDFSVTGNLDALITATTDAALAAENCLVAAESLDLGCCPVGSIRKHSAEIIDLFDLPDYTLPLFGIAIGKPTVEMRVKPRLPETTVVHYDSYQPLDYQNILDYDQLMTEFAEARETKIWSRKFADYFAQNNLPDYEDVLKKQKFL